MPDKRITVVDLYQLLRRWHDEQTISQISSSMGLDRKTIRGYLAQDSLKLHLEEIHTLINDPVGPLKPKWAYEVICQSPDPVGIAHNAHQIIIKGESYRKKTACKTKKENA